ncbi:MAG: radical SAM protein, partial [Desulfobulbaceae bacterium]|nr:radical SAM protein [Desulfobulbaceae bacterium]
MSLLLTTETGTIHKKWKGFLPVALIYPNTYPVAVSNLGFQLIYHQLNSLDFIVCERFVYPSQAGPLRSLESNRLLSDFPVVMFSISFENDYPNLISLLNAGLASTLATSRDSSITPGSPLIIGGGVAIFMNPEPLAPFCDLMVMGEAEAIVPELMLQVDNAINHGHSREKLCNEIGTGLDGCYAPSFYSFHYGNNDHLSEIRAKDNLPLRINRVIQDNPDQSAHSRLLSPDAELSMFMTELGRGCSRGCRFCAAGFIYRPPRLWSSDAIIKSLDERPAEIKRIGLLGMEMASNQVLDTISDYLRDNNCALSFSSLRADRISPALLSLLRDSSLKSAAIAPDGCSQRLRSVINKGLNEDDLINAAVRLVEAGIMHLKLYVMIGLPTESIDDLDELLSMLKRLQNAIHPLGRKRGRLCEITLSVNSFSPKPWTPFQYLSFGGFTSESHQEELTTKYLVGTLKEKIKYLRKQLKKTKNIRLKVDRPEHVLQQAIFARGDRRLAPVLMDMALSNMPLKKSLHRHGLSHRQ